MDNPCEHEWWVYSTAISDTPKILVQCRLCKHLGSTKHYTKEEWAQAYHAPSEPFLWEGTVEEIGGHAAELAEGIPVDEESKGFDVSLPSGWDVTRYESWLEDFRESLLEEDGDFVCCGGHPVDDNRSFPLAVSNKLEAAMRKAGFTLKEQ